MDFGGGQGAQPAMPPALSNSALPFGTVTDIWPYANEAAGSVSSKPWMLTEPVKPPSGPTGVPPETGPNAGHSQCLFLISVTTHLSCFLIFLHH